MYPFDYCSRANRRSLNSKEIFVVMPFDRCYDSIYHHLITPAVEVANERLQRTVNSALYPYRPKEDIRTISGWLNVLEHLTSAQVVIGVLTGSNPNVFYELGIAHATQPITRQILIAAQDYTPTFDIKDLIYFEYEQKFTQSVRPLGEKIADAVRWHSLEQERSILAARAHMGPDELEVMWNFFARRNFTFGRSPDFVEEFEQGCGPGSHERHLSGLTALCHAGLIGLSTFPPLRIEGRFRKLEFSYYWTKLGNQVLRSMQLIDDAELLERIRALPNSLP